MAGSLTQKLEFLISVDPQSAIKGFKDIGSAAEKELGKAEDKSKTSSANLTKFGAGALAFAGIVGVGLVKLGSDFDDAFDKIRVQTGATGDELTGLQNDFKSALSQVPNSMDEVSTAIAGVNQKLGLTGKPLQDVSVQFLNLSRLTGTDLSKNVQSATGLFNQFGITAESQGAKLDELFRITQSTGITFEKLTTDLALNGAAFRSAGLSFDESASLIGLLAKNGLDAASVIPALGKSMATAAKEGEPATKLFQDTFQAIKAAPNDTVAAGIALDVFGAKAGPKFAELVRQGTLSYDDFTAAIGNSGDTINGAAADTNDFGEKLGILRNKLEVAIEPAVSSAFDNLTAVVGYLGDAFASLPAPVVSAAGNIALFGTAAIGIAGAVSLLAGQIRNVVDLTKTVSGKLSTAVAAIRGIAVASTAAEGAVAGFGSALLTLAITNPEIGALIGLAAAVAYVGLTSHDSGDKVSQFNDDVKKLGGLDKYAEFLRSFGDANSYAGSEADKAAGITANAAAIHQRFLDILAESPEAAVQFKKAATDAGIATADWTVDVEAAAVSAAKSQQATDEWNSSVDAQKAKLDAAATAVENTGISADDYKKSVDAVTKATEEHTKSLQDEAAQLQAQADAFRAASDSTFALEKATRDQDQAFADLDKTVQEINGSSDDAATKQRNLANAYEDTAEKSVGVADAAVKQAQDQAKASGATVTSTGALDLWNKSMLNSASTATGPLHDAIVAHIAAVNGIPPEKVTEILASTPNIDEQKALIDAASANRALTIKADADTSAAALSVDAFVRSVQQKRVYIDVGARTGNTPVASAGGNLFERPSTTTIAETGHPEAVINGDQAVRLLWKLANGGMLGGGRAPAAASPPPAINVTVNGGGPGVAKEVVDELTWALRTGKVA